jgi:hypothetical protein
MTREPITLDDFRSPLTQELLPMLQKVIETVRERDCELHQLRDRVEWLEIATLQATVH